MKDLQRLVHLITREKLDQLAVPGKTADAKLNQFYDLLCDGQVSTHAEAAKLLYGKTERYTAYQQLCAKLEKQLIDMLVIMDVNQAVNEDSERAYQECWRLATIAQLLAIVGGTKAIHLAFNYGDRALRMAIEFEYTEIVLFICKFFRKPSATFLGDEERFSYYHELYLTYSERLKLEDRVEEKYEQLMLLQLNADTRQTQVAELGEQFFVELSPLLEQYDQLFIHRHIRFIQLTYLLHKRAYQELIIACESALIFFRAKAANEQSSLLAFISTKLLACAQLRQFTAGMAALEEAKNTLNDLESSTFFRLQELGILLCFHSREYAKAWTLLTETREHSLLREQACKTQQQWRIYAAYLEYLRLGEILPTENDGLCSNINLKKFLRQQVIYDQSERTTHVPLLIIQSLLLVSQKKYDDANIVIQSLQAYSSKYIKQGSGFRGNCFIQMLAQLPEAGFHRAATLRYAEKYWKKLQSLPIELANQSSEVEIVPYEDLWGMVLETLGNKRVKLKKSSLTKRRSSTSSPKTR